MKLANEGSGNYSSFPASNGWSIPTRNQFSIFAGEFGITNEKGDENHYSNYGLSDEHWTSEYYTSSYNNLVAGVVTITKRYSMSFKEGEILDSGSNSRATRWTTTF